MVSGTVEVVVFELAFGEAEGAELDGDAGTDADEGGEGAFVEGEWTFLGPDLAGGVEGVGVLGCGLQADFDDIKGLA